MNWEELTSEQKDVLVAEKIMGYETGEMPSGTVMMWNESGLVEPIPPYTQSMDAAWLVVEHFKGATLYALMPSDTDPKTPDMRYDVRLYTDEYNSYGATEKTMPLAICKAALQAAGVVVN